MFVVYFKTPLITICSFERQDERVKIYIKQIRRKRS